MRLNLENVRRTVTDLEGRLENRKKELQSMRHVTSATPVVLGGALVVPAGLLRKLRGEPAADPAAAFSADPAARARIEQLAMNAVRHAEEARGCRVVDVSAQKCGWDITSYPPAVDGKQPESRHIEVKGRVKGATTVTVTRTKSSTSWNQADKFHPRHRARRRRRRSRPTTAHPSTNRLGRAPSTTTARSSERYEKQNTFAMHRARVLRLYPQCRTCTQI